MMKKIIYYIFMAVGIIVSNLTFHNDDSHANEEKDDDNPHNLFEQKIVYFSDIINSLISQDDDSYILAAHSSHRSHRSHSSHRSGYGSHYSSHESHVSHSSHTSSYSTPSHYSSSHSNHSSHYSSSASPSKKKNTTPSHYSGAYKSPYNQKYRSSTGYENGPYHTPSNKIIVIPESPTTVQKSIPKQKSSKQVNVPGRQNSIVYDQKMPGCHSIDDYQTILYHSVKAGDIEDISKKIKEFSKKCNFISKPVQVLNFFPETGIAYIKDSKGVTWYVSVSSLRN